MPNNYDFLDAAGSVLTARSSITSGVAMEPYVIVSSIMSMPGITLSGNPSVSGTVGSSIVGQLPAGTAMIGSIATLQGTNPWITSGSVMLLNGANVIGSVATLQGTNPWIVSGSVMLLNGATIMGSVTALQGTNPWNISSIYGNVSGSVVTTQSGTVISSVVNSIPSSLLTGTYGHRNDAVASYLGGDLSWRPIATDSAGRITIKPFAAEESRVEGYVTLTSTSLTTLVAAAGTGLKNYITDLWFANTGATTTLVTFSDSAGSILGYTIAPTVSGSNLPGLQTPIRTGANASFNIQAGSNTSTLYATVKGFKAP